MPDRDDQTVEGLVPDFVTRGEGIPIWKLRDLGTFFDPDNLLLTLRFDDHRLLDPGTLGNYFVGTRGERILNATANAAATSRGSMTLVPSIWPGLPAILVAPSATNLWTNPSVELATTGLVWGANAQGGGWGRTLEDAVLGSYCGKAVCAGVGNRYVNTTAFTRGANDDVTIAVWVRSTTGESQIQFRLWNNAGGVDFVESIVTVGTIWTRLSVTALDATMDAWAGGGLTLRIWLINDLDNGTNKTWLFDSIGAFALAHDPGDVDGDMGDGYSWAGASHGTTSARVANYLDADAYAPMFNNNNDFSIRCMVQMPHDATAIWPVVYSRVWNLYESVANFIELFYATDTDAFWLHIKTSGADFLINSPVQTFEARDWISITCTIDYTADIYRIYVNGILAVEGTTLAAATSNFQNFRIGSDQVGANQGGFAFSEFVAFDCVLADVEVANLYAMRRSIIDGGAIDKQLNIGMIAYKVANQVASGGWDVIQIDTIEYNEHLVLDVSNYRIYITHPGWYTISGRISFASLTDGHPYAVGLRLNGATFISADTTFVGAAGSPTNSTYRSRYLVPGDYVELMGLTTAGRTMQALSAYSLYLEVIKIRTVFEGSY